MQTFFAFLLAVEISVIMGAFTVSLVPLPKVERPPGVYSFVTGLPKSDTPTQPKDDTKLAVSPR